VTFMRFFWPNYNHSPHILRLESWNAPRVAGFSYAAARPSFSLPLF
jgi:hypothetical protein